jgi:hypothetical protein
MDLVKLLKVLQIVSGIQEFKACAVVGWEQLKD